MATQPAAVGEIFNVTTSAVTSAAYIDALAAVTGAEPDVVPVPDEVAEKAEGPLFSRLFTPRHHGMLDVGKVTTLLGFVPAYDLAGGHAQTLDWLTSSGILSPATQRRIRCGAAPSTSRMRRRWPTRCVATDSPAKGTIPCAMP